VHTPDRQLDWDRTLAELTAEVRALSARMDGVQMRVEDDQAGLRKEVLTVLESLEHLHDDDRDARRRLRELRASPEYEAPFVTDEPLVSVLIPTWQSLDTLMDRAIPSALTQTHPAIEVVVVGDQSPPEVPEAISRLDEPRVRFHNLTVRGPYFEDPYRSWLASGTSGLNTGLGLARGLWIAPLGDDDAFEPDHVARLLAHAREHRYEFAYGRIHQIAPDGSETILGEFPPRLGAINLQAAVYHAGLRFLEFEFAHALFGTPNDWGLIRRMMRAGVRMGMVEDVVVRYWPSPRGLPPPAAEKTPEPPALAAERARVAQLEARAAALDARVVDERRRGDELEARMAELAGRLDEVRRSRSWRLTAPLRRLRSRR